MRARLAYDGLLMGAVSRILVDSLLGGYRRRMEVEGAAGGRSGAVTVVQRTSAAASFRVLRHRLVDQGDPKAVVATHRCVALTSVAVYGECMARLISTTVRLEDEDIRALKKARAAGHSTSELLRKGLRVVASRYYTGRRPPTTGLFESTDNKLGDESLLFKDIEH
jgi:hypothetical protein